MHWEYNDEFFKKNNYFINESNIIKKIKNDSYIFLIFFLFIIKFLYVLLIKLEKNSQYVILIKFKKINHIVKINFIK